MYLKFSVNINRIHTGIYPIYRKSVCRAHLYYERKCRLRKNYHPY